MKPNHVGKTKITALQVVFDLRKEIWPERLARTVDADLIGRTRYGNFDRLGFRFGLLFRFGYFLSDGSFLFNLLEILLDVLLRQFTLFVLLYEIADADPVLLYLNLVNRTNRLLTE